MIAGSGRRRAGDGSRPACCGTRGAAGPAQVLTLRRRRGSSRRALGGRCCRGLLLRRARRPPRVRVGQLGANGSTAATYAGVAVAAGLLIAAAAVGVPRLARPARDNGPTRRRGARRIGRAQSPRGWLRYGVDFWLLARGPPSSSWVTSAQRLPDRLVPRGAAPRCRSATGAFAGPGRCCGAGAGACSPGGSPTSYSAAGPPPAHDRSAGRSPARCQERSRAAFSPAAARSPWAQDRHPARASRSVFAAVHGNLRRDLTGAQGP